MSAYRDLMKTAGQVGDLKRILSLQSGSDLPANVAKDLDDAISYLMAARQLVQRAANATPQTAPISLPIAAE